MLVCICNTLCLFLQWLRFPSVLELCLVRKGAVRKWVTVLQFSGQVLIPLANLFKLATVGDISLPGSS